MDNSAASSDLLLLLTSARLGPGNLVAIGDAAAIPEATASTVEEVASTTALGPVFAAAVHFNGIALGVPVAKSLTLSLPEVALADHFLARPPRGQPLKSFLYFPPPYLARSARQRPLCA